MRQLYPERQSPAVILTSFSVRLYCAVVNPCCVDQLDSGHGRAEFALTSAHLGLSPTAPTNAETKELTLFSGLFLNGSVNCRMLLRPWS